MSTGSARDPRATLERELLERLGVEADAGPEQIEAAHEAVVDFLADAPRRLRSWARVQAAAADEAFALLIDPSALGDVAQARSTAVAQPPAEDTPEPAPARPSRRRTTRRHAAKDSTPPSDDVDALIAEVTPSAHRDEVRGPARLGARAVPWTGRSGRWLRAALAAGAVMAAVAVVIVVYQSGGTSPIAASEASPSAAPSAGLDEAQVAALMARVQSDPNDTDALMALGDAFFAAGEYDVAGNWLAKLVAIQPTNARALLALGAADYNAGNLSEAEQSWLQVVDLDPENVEAHYDLGWAYLQQEPSDLDAVRREWTKVLDLAPGTEVAQRVQQHLDALASPDPAASGGVTASPSAIADSTQAPSASVAP